MTLGDYLDQQAESMGIPKSLARAIVQQESAGRHDQVSAPGARGFFQLMPATAKELGVDPDDPFDNIRGGLTYFKKQLDTHKGDVRLALAAYNAGPGRTATGQVPNIPETQDYVQKILTAWGSGGDASPTAPATAQPAAAPAQPITTPGGMAGGPGPGPLPPAGGITTFQEPSALNLLKPIDLRTPEGRNNVAAMAGDVGGALLTRGLPVGGLLPKIAQVLTPMLFTGTAAAGERAFEESIGTVPPGGVAETGATQAGYNVLGQAFAWPVRHLFKLATGPSIARNTSAALLEDEAAAKRFGKTTVDAATKLGRAEIAQVSEEVRIAQEMLTAGQRRGSIDVTQNAAEHVGTAKRVASDVLADVESKNAAIISDVQKMYDDLANAAPSEFAGGAAVKQTLTGPTKRALDLAGQRVSTAAKTASDSGAEVDIHPLRQLVEKMVGQFRPPVMFPAAVPVAERAEMIGGVRMTPEMAQKFFTKGGGTGIPNLDQYVKYAAQKLGVPETSPLPGVLGKFMAIPPTVQKLSFEQAHQLKMLLDESVNFDAVARKHLDKITKGLRTGLRDEMRGDAEYDAATDAYHTVVQLYRKGVGAKIHRIAATPDGASQLANMLSTGRASQALVLKQLLVDQAAAGGDALAGQRAWDMVRQSFTFNKLTTGGLKGLGDRISKLVTERPEFVRVVYGDTSGTNVLKNLGSIADAFEQAEATAAQQAAQATERGAAGVADARRVGEFAKGEFAATAKDQLAAAQRAGRSRVQVAKDLARERIDTTKQAAADAAGNVQREAKAFTDTKLSRSARIGAGEGELSDVARILTLGPSQKWAAYSALRLLLGAPRSSEMLTYVVNSPQLTQRLTNLLLRPGPPEATAEFLRYMDSLMGDAPVMSDAYQKTLARTDPSSVPTRAQGAGPRGNVTLQTSTPGQTVTLPRQPAATPGAQPRR